MWFLVSGNEPYKVKIKLYVVVFNGFMLKWLQTDYLKYISNLTVKNNFDISLNKLFGVIITKKIFQKTVKKAVILL